MPQLQYSYRSYNPLSDMFREKNNLINPFKTVLFIEKQTSDRKKKKINLQEFEVKFIPSSSMAV